MTRDENPDHPMEPPKDIRAPLDDPSKQRMDRIIEARLKLKARFEDKIKNSPALADTAPQGSGASNRHGMPKLPVGQYQTQKWPVLDLGIHPEISLQDWRLRIDGACEHPVELTWAAFLALPQSEDISDFHCVTTWSKMDMQWRGVRFSDLAALVGIDPSVRYVMCHGYDGYTTNIVLHEAMKPDVLLVHEANQQPLTREHGGPLRMITPQLYAWKGAKWISRIEFLREHRRGFWEQHGYSNSAHPWRNDRYNDSEQIE